MLSHIFRLFLPAAGAFLFSSESSLAQDIDERRDGIDFIIRNMPEPDRGKVPLSRVEQEVDEALSARSGFAWAEGIPWEIYRNNVLPYAVIDEARDSWRSDLKQMMAPVVENCRTDREAILTIASRIGEVTKVKYSIDREKPNQSPKESMKSGLVSCTGQSILLVGALRSVGIPARLAGVLQWSHFPGNHTWVEAWCSDRWEMIEWNEKDFNTPWVMENIGMLDISKKVHKVIATSWGGGDAAFPLIWRYGENEGSLSAPSSGASVPGIDVTERYMELSKKWYGRNPSPGNSQRLYVDFRHVEPSGKVVRKPARVLLKDGEGRELGRGITPSPENDMRQFLQLSIPLGTVCLLEWERSDGTLEQKEIISTDTPVQIVNLEETGI